jgi:hypothetical protein
MSTSAPKLRIAIAELAQETDSFSPLRRIPRPIFPFDDVGDWQPDPTTACRQA